MFGGNRKQERILAQFGKRKEDYFDFSGIEEYSEAKVSAAKRAINDCTWHDLDLNELFMYLDRCCSAIGQQLLYARLKAVSFFVNPESWEAQIAMFKKDKALKELAILELDGLKDSDVYQLHNLFHEPYLEKPKWYWAIQLMSYVAMLSIATMLFVPNFWLAAFPILAINFGLHYWNKRNLMLYSQTMPHLLTLIYTAKKLSEAQHDQDEDLKNSIDTLRELAGSLSLFRIEKGVQTDVGQFVEVFIELLKGYFLLEPITLFKTLKRLEESKADIERLYNYVAEIDLALSIDALRKELPYWCKPDFVDEANLKVEALYHPLLPYAVSNDLQLSDKSLLLTGSNMSGKTTFIRSMGINAVCATALNTCFCEQYSAPLLQVSSAIRISDDLMSDKSYFQEEMLVIKSMLAEAESGSGHFFLLDELMKGTNTLERIAIGKAILDQLNAQGNLVAVATHDLELADLLKEHFDLYHFSEVIEEDLIQFDYLLKPGKLTNTNAIRILEINGYPQSLTTEAAGLSSK